MTSFSFEILLMLTQKSTIRAKIVAFELVLERPLADHVISWTSEYASNR